MVLRDLLFYFASNQSRLAANGVVVSMSSFFFLDSIHSQVIMYKNINHFKQFIYRPVTPCFHIESS